MEKLLQTDQKIGLRDWAVTIDALGAGKQILLMRKGGIHEETRHFEIQADQFYLFPAYEHQKRELLKPEFQQDLEKTLQDWSPENNTVSIKFFAQLHEDITLIGEEKLASIYSHHIWTQDFAVTRLKWKKKLPLHILLLRVYQLKQPIEIEMSPEYGGCKSWLRLPIPEDERLYQPVISDEKFFDEVEQIKEKLK